jgi:hypothetical protein
MRGWFIKFAHQCYPNLELDTSKCIVHEDCFEAGWQSALQNLKEQPVNGELPSQPEHLQQLKAKIAAIIKETDEACNGDCDCGEILNDLVANLRQLSAI